MKKPTILERLKKIEDVLFKQRVQDPVRCSQPPAGWTCSRYEGHDGPCAARPGSIGPNVCTEAAKGGPCSYWGPRGGSHHHCRLGLRHVIFGTKCLCRCGNSFDPEPWRQVVDPLFEYYTEQGVKKVYTADHAPAQAKVYANHAEHWFNKFQETEKTVVRQRLNLVTSQEANESLSQRVDELIHERDRVQQDKVALTDALAYQSIRVKDLKRALEVYGVHYYGCSWHNRGIFSSLKPRVCDCGLKKAVNG